MSSSYRAHTPRRRALLCLTALATAGVASDHARQGSDVVTAQTAATVEVELYDREFIVSTVDAELPRVSIATGGGFPLYVAPDLIRRRSARRWDVSLESEFDGQIAPLAPGDEITVAERTRITTIVLPELVAVGDAALDVVSGQAPWPGAITVQLMHDARMTQSAALPDPFRLTSDASGRFSLPLRGRIDLGPGWWGTAEVVRSDGNRFRTAFAPPAVYLAAATQTFELRADAGTDAALIVLDEAGHEVDRRRATSSLGSGLRMFQTSPFAMNDRRPLPGDRFRIEIDGRTAIDVVRPRLAGRYDPELGQLTGQAPPGAAVKAVVGFGAGAPDSTTADGQGRWRFAFEPSDAPLAIDGAVLVAVRVGPAMVETFYVQAPFERFRLFGNRLVVGDDGFGPTTLELIRAAGGRPIRRITERMPEAREHIIDLYDANGQPVVLAPGDVLTVEPDGGTTVAFPLPPLTAALADDGQGLIGQAPPGAAITADVWARPPSPTELLAPPGTVQIRLGERHMLSSRAAADGRYALDDCSAPCRIARAHVRASAALTAPAAGRPQPELRWLADPIVGISASTGNVLGYATAGMPVRVAVVDAFDRAVAAKDTSVTDPSGAPLPLWTTDWRDRYPAGIPAGTRVHVWVDGARTELHVPAASFAADTDADRVDGAGPPGFTAAVWSLPTGQDANLRVPTGATGVVGADGRWSVTGASTSGFDLRPGDDLLVNLIAPDGRTFFQFNEASVGGPGEPTRTVTPGATPGAMPTSPVNGGVYLPITWAD